MRALAPLVDRRAARRGLRRRAGAQAGALPADVGLLVAAEPPVRAQWNGEPRTAIDPERRAAYVVRNGGDALKFLVQWRPGRPREPGEPDLAAEALAAIGEVVEDCRRGRHPERDRAARGRGSPTSRRSAAAAAGELVIQSATQMAAQRPDLLKLEWPGGAEGCRRVSDGARVGAVDAAVGGRRASRSSCERVRIALDNGASGFIAGRAIWGEAVTLTGEARVAFLEATAVPRLAALCELLAQHGRSWREAAA